jgi:Flp pilus assembly CpaE family ATPase
MKKELKKYLAEIGSKGGKASRRKITPAQQAAMQEARKAARLRKEQNSVLSQTHENLPQPESE